MKDDGELGDVRRHQRDRVSRPHAARHQASGEGRHGPGELGVGVGAAGRAIDDGGAIGDFGRLAEHVRRDGHIGNDDVGQRAVVDGHVSPLEFLP